MAKKKDKFKLSNYKGLYSFIGLGLSLIIIVIISVIVSKVADNVLYSDINNKIGSDNYCTKVLKEAAFNDKGECRPLKHMYYKVQRGNPAVEKCVELHGVVRSEEVVPGEYEGICMFVDDVECNMWDLYNNRCK